MNGNKALYIAPTVHIGQTLAAVLHLICAYMTVQHIAKNAPQCVMIFRLCLLHLFAKKCLKQVLIALLGF